MNRQVSKDHPDRRIGDLARRQHGMVERAQLMALGLTLDAIEGRVKRGSLRSVHRGVYSVGHLALTRHGRFMAAVLACGEGAALSHFSAAVVWGILGAEGHPVHVTAENRRRCRGVVVHRAPLQGERLMRIGIVVTTPARTIVDLADVVPRRRILERAIDEAEYLRLDWQSAAPRRGRKGSGLLSSVLAVHTPGSTRTLSELEEIFLAVCDRSGFPRPEVNCCIEGYLCDFVWREQRLIVETDGEQAHGTARARGRDAVRDAELQLAGWMVIRVSYARLLNDPDGVAAQVGNVLKQAPAAPVAPHPR
jgi:hypothetical protein